MYTRVRTRMYTYHICTQTTQLKNSDCNRYNNNINIVIIIRSIMLYIGDVLNNKGCPICE